MVRFACLFLCGLEVVGQCECGGAFARSAGSVAELRVEACETQVSNKCGRVFSLVGAGQVLREHLCGERGVTFGFDKHAGTIEESHRSMAVACSSGLRTVDRGLHFVEPILMPVEAGEAGPLKSGMGTGGDSLLELALGGGEIFLPVGDGCAQVMRTSWIDLVELGGDGLSLVNAAANNTGSLAIELAKVGEGVGVARIEADGLFKLRACLASEAEGVHEAGVACSLADRSSEPKVIVGVVGVEVHGFIALIGGRFPFLESQANTAGEIVGPGLIDSGGRQRAKKCQRFIGLTILEATVGLSERIAAEWVRCARD